MGEAKERKSKKGRDERRNKEQARSRGAEEEEKEEKEKEEERGMWGGQRVRKKERVRERRGPTLKRSCHITLALEHKQFRTEAMCTLHDFGRP